MSYKIGLKISDADTYVNNPNELWTLVKEIKDDCIQ